MKPPWVGFTKVREPEAGPGRILHHLIHRAADISLHTNQSPLLSGFVHTSRWHLVFAPRARNALRPAGFGRHISASLQIARPQSASRTLLPPRLCHARQPLRPALLPSASAGFAPHSQCAGAPALRALIALIQSQSRHPISDPVSVETPGAEPAKVSPSRCDLRPHEAPSTSPKGLASLRELSPQATDGVISRAASPAPRSCPGDCRSP